MSGFQENAPSTQPSPLSPLLTHLSSPFLYILALIYFKCLASSKQLPDLFLFLECSMAIQNLCWQATITVKNPAAQEVLSVFPAAPLLQLSLWLE